MSNYEITTHTIKENNTIRFGVFISHSTQDTKHKEDIEEKIKSSKLHKALIAEKFISDGKDFHKSIKEHLHCHAGVIIVSENALASNWVSYECGYFDGEGIPVILWDPENALSYTNPSSNLLNVYLLQHMTEVVRTVEEVIERLDKISIYANMFKYSTNKFQKSDFDKIIQSKVDTAIVNIMCDDLMKHKSLFERCKLSTLVVNFGMFYNNQKNGLEDECLCVSDKPLFDRVCHHTGKQCALISSPQRCDEKLPDCIILNHVIPNGKFVDENEKETGKDKASAPAMLQFFVPVHREYGTEFKFIIDAPNPTIHEEIRKKCLEFGFNPTVSDTMDNLRIYLSLDDAPDQGFFRLNDGQYYNNFLCPHAAMEKR